MATSEPDTAARPVPANLEPWCGSRWLTDPPDGVLCLVGTRRVLDVNGHCCDYERCAATKDRPNRIPDRCLLDPGHDGPHHGSSCRAW